MHAYPIRALAVLAALGLLCLSAPALAHHRPGPCDLHRGADETVRSHSRRLVRCAAERWEVPGGVETALCIAQAESGLNPETASEGGDFLGLYQHSAEAWPERFEAWTRDVWELDESALSGRTNAIVTIRMVNANGWGPWEGVEGC
ncbi:MAG: hypothetical protein ACRDHU_04915 [Actinomycetota bacterium]